MELNYKEVHVRGQNLVEAGKLTVPNHGITVIRGKNGCGKSLLLRRIVTDSENEGVRICCMNQSRETLILSVGVLENIAMSTHVERLEKIRGIIKCMGFENLLSKEVSRLSGGEARMVCALRCLLSDAELIVMDEPTNDLDYEMVEHLIKLVTGLCEKKTFLIVTHDDRVEKAADVVYELKNSEIRIVKDNSGNRNDEEKKRKSISKSSETVGSGVVTADDTDQQLEFIRRLLPVNFWTVFSILVLCAALGYGLERYCKITGVPDNMMPAHQLLLFQPNSSWAAFEAVPYGGVLAENVDMLRTVDLSEMLRNLKEMEQKQKTRFYQVETSIDLVSSELYEVYPLEYYDAKEGMKYRVMDQYFKDYYPNNTACVLNTYGEFQIAPNACIMEPGAIEIPFEKAKWSQTASKLSKNGYSCIAAYVVMKDRRNSMEFLDTTEFQSLFDHDVYVMSDEILHLYAEAQGIRYVWDMFPVLVPLMGTAIFTTIALMMAYFLSQTTKILTCRDYGISEEVLLRGSVEKACCRYPLIVPVIGFFVWNIVRTRNLPLRQANCFFSILLIAGTSIAFVFMKCVTRRYYRMLYRWNQK